MDIQPAEPQQGQVEPQGPGGGEQGGGGPDFTPIFDRLDEINTGMGEQLSQIEQRFAAQGEQEPAAQEPELFIDQAGQLVDQMGSPVDQFGNPLQQQQQPQGFPQQGQQPQGLQDPGQGLQQLQSQLQETVLGQVQEQISPILEHHRQQELSALEQEFPELADSQTALPYIERAQQRAQQYGDAELWRDASFIRDTYLIAKAEQNAASEIPAGAEGDQAHLETGGVTGGSQAEVDPGDRVVQAGNGGTSFWG